jgi:Trypsin
VKYTFDDGNTSLAATGFACGGTLVGRDIVVSAAHCISKSFDYTYKGKTYTIPIAPNSYYPTWESMFTMYLGGHDVSQVPATVTPPMIRRNVLSVIIV